MLVAAVFMGAAGAVPPGYRYVGSRVVSEGRVVYWYWNADYVELAGDGTAFVARLYARAVDVDRERPYVAVIRCDQRAYRELGSRAPFEAIDDGEPIDAVWRAGCRDGRARNAAERSAHLAGGASPPAPAATAAPTLPAAPPPAPAARPAAKNVEAAPADPRRADACVRFAETAATPAGDATITNTCAFPVEVTLCYKGAGTGAFDCATPVRGRKADSLAPGAVHVLPEYRRGRNKGIALVACKGALGAVFPRLDDAGRGSGCY
jgi:hypothetical protein